MPGMNAGGGGDGAERGGTDAGAGDECGRGGRDAEGGGGDDAGKEPGGRLTPLGGCDAGERDGGRSSVPEPGAGELLLGEFREAGKEARAGIIKSLKGGKRLGGRIPGSTSPNAPRCTLAKSKRAWGRSLLGRSAFSTANQSAVVDRIYGCEKNRAICQSNFSLLVWSRKYCHIRTPSIADGH